MKLLLLGASGLLGRQVAACFHDDGWEIAAPTHREIDLACPKAVTALLTASAPDLIINCAAQRKPDLCEGNSPEVQALNITLPRLLAESARPFIHISTDYVFNGANAPYAEDTRRCPINAYGRQKAAAEAAIEEASNVLILRLPILFGPTPDLRNSAVTILAANLLAARGACVKMDDLAIRYPTFTCDIARQLLRLAKPVCAGTLRGIAHYSAQEPMTKFQMALTMAPLIGVDPAQCLPDHTPPAVPRPYDCHLSTRRLRQLGLFVEPTPFATALIQTLSAAH
ncbi:MAG: dTDP-4-dehydrorhamnose reductase family protein [Candidatus Spyradenecus sp.]